MLIIIYKRGATGLRVVSCRLLLIALCSKNLLRLEALSLKNIIISLVRLSLPRRLHVVAIMSGRGLK
jgi:hypothetical protein